MSNHFDEMRRRASASHAAELPRRMRAIALVFVFTWVLTALGCGPLVMVPGGRLDGTPRPVPDDWSFSNDTQTVQLETRPDDPYSVNLWGVGVGDVFYVAAGNSTSRWAEHLLVDPRARLKVGDELFEVRAAWTDDPDDLEAFLSALQDKYDYEPDAEQRGSASLFRLTAR